MSNTARNYHAHGGSHWVVGGRLTFLPGATVEGAEGLFDLPSAKDTILTCVPPSEATTIAQLREDFNALLSVMKRTSVMASTSVESTDPEDEQNPHGQSETV